MKQNDAKKMLNDLMSYYGKSPESLKSTVELYLSLFCKCPVTKSKALFQRIVKSFQYFPRLSELDFIENSFQGAPMKITNQEFCFACKNTGVIWYTKQVKSMGDTAFSYEFVSRCPCCEKGKQYPDFPSFAEIAQPFELEDLIEYNRRWLRPTSEEVQQARRKVENFSLGGKL